MILQEFAPYAPKSVERIQSELLAIAGLTVDDLQPGSAALEKVQRAIRSIAEAASRAQASREFRTIDAAYRSSSRPVTKRSGKPLKAPRQRRWRVLLKRLRRRPAALPEMVADKDVRAVLSHALVQAGLAEKAGRRWLHFLHDHPEALVVVIDAALSDQRLEDGRGRKDRTDQVVLLEGVDEAFRLLTGRPLSLGHSSETKSRPGNQPSGPGFRLARACLAPFEPRGQIADESVARTIKQLRKRAAHPPRIIEDPSLLDGFDD